MNARGSRVVRGFRVHELKIKIDDMPDLVSELFFLYFSVVDIVINFITYRLGVRDYSGIIYGFIAVLLVIFSFRTFLRRIRLQDMIFCLVVIAMFFLSWAAVPEVRGLIESNAPTFFLTVFPCYFIGLLFGNAKIRTLRLMNISRFVILFLTALTVIGSTGVERMGVAYGILPFLMAVTYNLLWRKKLIDIIFMLAGVVTLAICVTRGPILLYLIFFLIICLIQHRKKTVVAAGILIIVFSVEGIRSAVITGLESFFRQANLNTRLFRYFNKLGITDDNGRNALAEPVIRMIKQNPFFGNGLYSDRIATMNVSWVSERHETGHYVHNFFYEVICHWGFVIGLLIIGAVFWLGIQAARFANSRQRIVLLIFALCFVGKLFMSGSYLQERGFYAFIGLAVAFIRNGRSGNREQ